MCEPAKFPPLSCDRLSEPRPAAPCSHKTIGYFCAGSQPGGTKRRYCIASPLGLRYEPALNPSTAAEADWSCAKASGDTASRTMTKRVSKRAISSASVSTHVVRNFESGDQFRIVDRGAGRDV